MVVVDEVVVVSGGDVVAVAVAVVVVVGAGVVGGAAVVAGAVVVDVVATGSMVVVGSASPPHPAAIKPRTTRAVRVRISVFFASTELEVPDRALRRWVPRGLAFVHKLISADLVRHG